MHACLAPFLREIVILQNKQFSATTTLQTQLRFLARLLYVSRLEKKRITEILRIYTKDIQIFIHFIALALPSESPTLVKVVCVSKGERRERGTYKTYLHDCRL